MSLLKKTLGNFSFSLFSNLVSFLISSSLILIVPKVLDIESYGYWQLYMFYMLYGGFLLLGWNDGILLRYGGEYYDNLDRKLFFSQFYMVVFSQLVVSSILIFIATLLYSGDLKYYVYITTIISFFIVNVRIILLYLLQGTNRIKEYSYVTIVGRVSYFFTILIFIALGTKNYVFFIIADLIGKTISLLFAMYFTRGIVFNKISDFYLSYQETYKNISVGIRLLFANIANMLIVGVVRYGIEKHWSIDVFGKVSLVLSISFMLMIFMNALGVVLFPTFRRVPHEKLSSLYSTIGPLLSSVLLLLLIGYYPIVFLINIWLPEYSDSLIYLAILFPIIVFESRMSLIVNPYLKTLRYEKLLYRVNILVLGISLLGTFLIIKYTGDLYFLISLITVLLALRYILLEFMLSKQLGVSTITRNIKELLVVSLFIYINIETNLLTGFFLYTSVAVSYLYSCKKNLSKSLLSFKSSIRT